MAIKYEAYTRLGQKVKGVLSTDSEDDAYTMLQREELIPYRLRTVRPRPTLVQLMPGLFRPNPQDIIDFTRQLAALLNTGIPIRRALTTQRDQTRSPGLKEALRQIIRDIEAGGRFSESFSRHTTVFPEFYLRLLRVGEATGGIPFTLQQLTDNMQRRKAAGDRVRRALLYPAVSLAVAFVAAFVTVTYSLPALTTLLEEFGGQLPVTTRAMITISDVLQSYGTYVLGCLAGLAALVVAAMRTAEGRRLRDSILLRTPRVGRILLASNMFSLTTTLAALLRAGVAPVEALGLAEKGVGNAVLRERLAEVTRHVSEGTKLGAAFDQERGFPSVLSQAIVVGEMRGNLVDALTGLAEYYEDVTDQAVSGATELIQPAIILIIAGIVGFVAVAVVSGIYSTLGAIH